MLSTAHCPEEWTHGPVELFQHREKDKPGQKEGLISMSCTGQAQKEDNLTASHEGDVRLARREPLHNGRRNGDPWLRDNCSGALGAP